jgi:hypothetical protein
MERQRFEDREHRKVVERLLRVWDANAHLRLGQVIARATDGVLLEYVLDAELLDLIEKGVTKTERRQLRREFPLNTV